jgi:heat shock protein HslJ
MLLLLSACGWLLTDERVTTAQASGTWELVSLSVEGLDVPIPNDTGPTLVIEPGSFGGHAGCNSFGAEVSETASRLSVGGAFQTLIGCSDEINQFEVSYLRALERVTEMHRRGTELTLMGPGVELRYKRSAAAG